ncbi:MAG: PRC-barrel domain-containing protein [Candidatus Hydrogenedentes bacterium]|nr:PRC-barrel domain-containing protein [Candidatus Hydrogenedentota bacterium]
MAGDRITIGVVRSVNPVRREVRLTVEATAAHLLPGLGWLQFSLQGGREVRGKVVKATPHHTGPIVELAAGMTRDTVAQLKDATVWIPASEWAPPDEEAFRAAHLLDMQVVDGAGIFLGTVVDVMETPANAAVTIERPDGNRFLLPVIPEVITAVDLDEAIVRVGDIGPYAVEE